MQLQIQIQWLISCYRPNYSSPYAPPETFVTIFPYYNIYVYSRLTLWLLYGIGIALTLLSITSGIFSVVANGGSYMNKFSTILRVSRAISLSAPVMIADADGKDPTPRYVDDLIVSFPADYTPIPEDVRMQDYGNSQKAIWSRSKTTDYVSLETEIGYLGRR